MMQIIQKMQMMRKLRLQICEETEEPSGEEEIHELASVENHFQETNNTDESNDDTDAESEEQGKRLLNEDKGNRKVEEERDDEAAEEERDDQDEEERDDQDEEERDDQDQEERDDQDEEEEEDGEGEDTQSVKTYVKNTIRFDDDDERNPHATSSPKGNITIMLYISVQCHVSKHEI